MSELKKTSIYPEYERLGAKTIDFGGWDMPVQFSSIKQEHEATRTHAGLFDVSHMGEIVVKGEKSLEFLQKMVTNDVSKLSPKRAQYTFMCYQDGGTIDDFLIYMIEEDHYFLVVNAANTEKDFEWMMEHNDYSEDELTIENVSANYGLLALQGPNAEKILQTLTETNLSEIKFFRFEENVKFTGIEQGSIVSRTGYTGEDGFEIYIDSHASRELWNNILEAGKNDGLLPVGLGARDTLRFEANLPLYGQELSKDISPIEAGLKFAVKVDKATNFIGKQALKEQVENGANRELVALEMLDRGIPRTGYEVYYEGEKIGSITSGTQSPTLKKNIGLALVKSNVTEVGTEIAVQVRKRKLKAEIIETPFLNKK
ncbi:glycine cleavage system aminomethyltransferase GcvT [Virgibacillus sp. MSJ-26]|uniref:glycine cleavage system aminomethyltransferase GcvT n=1 Tax=Virgibacillus sp. MSJ-26 TaxID=2841522 RepID=UPI001C116C39|nr:glycine cleavage system aminomethyltransferase GcvT [Virgibacillus sp. MSJ-26]